jgi:hypothetical protein
MRFVREPAAAFGDYFNDIADRFAQRVIRFQAGRTERIVSRG